MPDDAGGFGARLGACRRRAGLSQRELADRSGLSTRAVSNLEVGRTRWPHPDSVRRLADALGLRGEQRSEFVADAGRRLAGAAGPAATTATTARPVTAAEARAEVRSGALGPLQAVDGAGSPRACTGGATFTIGEFARHGRVSVGMLRRYDAIGLLQPALVDPVSGRRSYEARQLPRLNRIVALKDLGFSLEQVRSILDDKVSAEELHGMLRLRRAELQSQVEAGTARLAQVEARLEIIEKEGAMPADDVQVERIAPNPSVSSTASSGQAAGCYGDSPW